MTLPVTAESRGDRFVHRYELDPSRPQVTAALRDAGVRALAPAVLWWAVVVASGLVIVHVLDGFRTEDAVDRWFAHHRTTTLDTVSAVFSTIGSTPYAIGACVLVALLVLWRTRQWWFAVVAPLALSLQALVFASSATVVGRSRPDVVKLDDSPPTSSFPSGHTSASSALYFTVALIAQRIEHDVLRRTVTVVALLVPFCVATARLYRGMHAPLDVTFGLLNGTVCMVLAWGYLRRDVRAQQLQGTQTRSAAGRTVTSSVVDGSTTSPST
ncbi:phosphatase PAP2 family protein [Luteimicrobium sp. NPDC057192]|uniref:phosphatase PAP2 family protein n=1 Tax=Luteimicrobium sp. NPDC057192 TaxID=3346042 RepID=UPI00362D2E0E